MRLKILLIILVIVIIAAGGYYFCLCKQKSPVLIIDSFEGKIIGGENATVDYGSGAGATVDVSPARKPVIDGRQSLKIIYDVSGGGYMWIARGYNLTQKNAAQWKISPGKIKWENYNALIFYLYGEGSSNKIAVDLIDNGKEYWRFLITDDTTGWKEVIIPFSEFSVRTDWQPDSARRNNTMDFPINVFQFEPKSGKGILFIDKVSLRKRGI